MALLFVDRPLVVVLIYPATKSLKPSCCRLVLLLISVSDNLFRASTKVETGMVSMLIKGYHVIIVKIIRSLTINVPKYFLTSHLSFIRLNATKNFLNKWLRIDSMPLSCVATIFLFPSSSLFHVTKYTYMPIKRDR